MIKGVLIVNACGGLIYQNIKESAFAGKVEIDKLIALASTIYTAIEILSDLEVCTRQGKYKRLSIRYELASITALKTQTGLIFVIIHDHTDSAARISALSDRMHRTYIDDILYSPEYYVDDRIPKKIFNDIL
ncbi:trafficking protein particle complex subunit 4 [Nematocida minor]|uniref:trafficking protein particle complex subunit 4 n=1 Tax=Nematocida minor TaxID=1912983 RepID=UPI00221FDCA7|nr:trafficking protein particle complex subunit 4 [Nematocida minor]KAI5189847.1 trafficking protein particle complex subunit 4 [Nematocida minor]